MSVNQKNSAADRSMMVLIALFVLVIAGISYLAPPQLDPVPGTPAPNPYTVVR